MHIYWGGGQINDLRNGYSADWAISTELNFREKLIPPLSILIELWTKLLIFLAPYWLCDFLSLLQELIINLELESIFLKLFVFLLDSFGF